MRRLTALCLILLACSAVLRGEQPAAVRAQRALDQTTRDTPAVALVVDVKSGRLLAVKKAQDAARLRSRPGSILKPFFLAGALEQGVLRPQTTVFCRRSLRILGRNLECTHPQSDFAFSADDALAYSCNTYFAELANRLSPAQAATILRSYGFGVPSHLFAVEASSELRAPVSKEQKELFVLGLEEVTVTPAQMAVAYRRLALRMKSADAGPLLRVVAAGMTHSVQYGMAHDAEVPGLEIAGKTGTASDPGQPWTHGWFAGIAGKRTEEIVVVIYLPRGNGADAARIAKRFFLEWMEQGQ
jgi:cell division protein FtsI/penicillin-binding protein 2